MNSVTVKKTKYPDILFLSPVVPRSAGHGAAMRAGLNLEALSRSYHVHLVVFRLGDSDPTIPHDVANLCRSVQLIDVPDISPLVAKSNFSLLKEFCKSDARLLREYPVCSAADAYQHLDADIPIRLIHCFRLCLFDIATALAHLCRLPDSAVTLDLDDFESRSASRSAEANKGKLGRLRYLLNRREAQRICNAEQSASKNCGRLLLCSEHDRSEFLKKHPDAPVSVVANGYRFTAPLTSSTDKQANNTLVFVGTLSYQPNYDALHYFFDDIWPQLLRISDNDVQIIVAGRTPPADIMALCQKAGARLLADPKDIRDAYRAASALVVPLRMGGGTRIKILEALGFGKSVISTTIGAEGLELAHEEHLLIADTSEDFALACHNTLSQPRLSGRRAAAGRDRVKSLYSPDAIEQQIAAAYAHLTPNQGIKQ